MSVGVNGAFLPINGAAIGEANGPASSIRNKWADGVAALSIRRGFIDSIRWPGPRRGTERGGFSRLCFNCIFSAALKGNNDPTPCLSISIFYYETIVLQFLNIKVLQNMQLWRFGLVDQGIQLVDQHP